MTCVLISIVLKPACVSFPPVCNLRLPLRLRADAKHKDSSWPLFFAWLLSSGHWSVTVWIRLCLRRSCPGPCACCYCHANSGPRPDSTVASDCVTRWEIGALCLLSSGRGYAPDLLVSPR